VIQGLPFTGDTNGEASEEGQDSAVDESDAR
jgi:hypothetical protein